MISYISLNWIWHSFSRVVPLGLADIAGPSGPLAIIPLVSFWHWSLARGRVGLSRRRRAISSTTFCNSPHRRASAPTCVTRSQWVLPGGHECLWRPSSRLLCHNNPLLHLNWQRRPLQSNQRSGLSRRHFWCLRSPLSSLLPAAWWLAVYMHCSP